MSAPPSTPSQEWAAEQRTELLLHFSVQLQGGMSLLLLHPRRDEDRTPTASTLLHAAEERHVSAAYC